MLNRILFASSFAALWLTASPHAMALNPQPIPPGRSVISVFQPHPHVMTTAHARHHPMRVPVHGR
jgi:hypothetical protein